MQSISESQIERRGSVQRRLGVSAGLAASLVCGLALTRVLAQDAAPAAPQPAQDPSQHQHSMPGMTMPGDQPGSAAEEVHLHAHFSSGTGWQPLEAPDNMWMTSLAGWDVMAHGNLFATFNHQGGPRGVGKLESMSMAMLMEQKQVGRGTLLFREMFSGDALTAPHGGFPQLFQTGETYRGRPLVDHQHPHDVFGELSALYTLPVGERVSWFAYGGPAAEPALGPVAYVHRASAAEIPSAPLSHHLQDSTHISYGVITSGVVVTAPLVGALKIEGSGFNGREPDEHRATIDLGALESWAVRVAANPTRQWSVQYSAGHLTHPEALELTDILRQTASLAYSREFTNGHWCSTVVWGRNRKLAERSTQNSYLAESAVNFAERNYAFTRLELVDKDELFPPGPTAHAPALPPSSRIGAYTFGGVRDLVHNHKWNIGLGAGVTVYSKPAALDAVYGRNPVSWEVHLRFRPGMMKMD